MSKKPPVYFDVYQLKEGREYDKFRGFDTTVLEHSGLMVSKCNYNLVWQGVLPVQFKWNNVLNYLLKICDLINYHTPEEYKGKALSVSDVIVIRTEEESRAYYFESISFTSIDCF